MLWCPLLNIEIYLKKKKKHTCVCVCLSLCICVRAYVHRSFVFKKTNNFLTTAITSSVQGQSGLSQNNDEK